MERETETKKHTRKVLKDKTFQNGLRRFLELRGPLSKERVEIITEDIKDQIEAIRVGLAEDNPQLTIEEWRKRLEGVSEEMLYHKALRRFLDRAGLLNITWGMKGQLDPKVAKKIDKIVLTFAQEEQEEDDYMHSLTLEEWIDNLIDEGIITAKQADNENFKGYLKKFLEDRKYLGDLSPV